MGASSPPDFRAPPPSPVASSRRASFTANEDVLTEFLDKCGRVPNLVLPDKVFPKHRFLHNPPTLDFLHLDSLSTQLLDAVSSLGCFQLINHGVPEAMVRAAMGKAIANNRTEELVVVYRDNADDDPSFCSHIRELMGEAERIGKTLRGKLGGTCQEEEEGIEVCYVKKHNKNRTSESEAIRTLIRGYDERHSLCISFCNAEFHVYSKRGWFSFTPRPDAVVVTVGDRGWNGRFKGVVGRPLLYHSGENSLGHSNYISITFLYNTITTGSREKRKTEEKIITVSQQLLVALFIILLFPFFLH